MSKYLIISSSISSLLKEGPFHSGSKNKLALLRNQFMKRVQSETLLKRISTLQALHLQQMASHIHFSWGIMRTLWIMTKLLMFYRYINEFKKGNRPLKDLEVDFLIAEYPEEVLQYVRSKNAEAIERKEAKKLPFLKTELYFPHCRKLVTNMLGFKLEIRWWNSAY